MCFPRRYSISPSNDYTATLELSETSKKLNERAVMTERSSLVYDKKIKVTRTGTELSPKKFATD